MAASKARIGWGRPTAKPPAVMPLVVGDRIADPLITPIVERIRVSVTPARHDPVAIVFRTHGPKRVPGVNVVGPGRYRFRGYQPSLRTVIEENLRVPDGPDAEPLDPEPKEHHASIHFTELDRELNTILRESQSRIHGRAAEKRQYVKRRD